MTLRRCPDHRVTLVERNGAPYCQWRIGHYPSHWIEVDLKTGNEVTVAPGDGAAREVERLRAAAATPTPHRLAPPPAPAPKPKRERGPEMPKAAASSPAPVGAPAPAPTGKRRCSNCRQYGCRADRCPRPPAEPVAQKDPPSASRTASAPRSSERLVAFLYVLLRDELTASRIERALEHGTPARFSFGNPHLEAYAREISERLIEVA